MRLRDGVLLLALAAAGGVAFLILRPGERPPGDAASSLDAAEDRGLPDAPAAATPNSNGARPDAMPAARMAEAMSHGGPTRGFPKGDASIAGVVVDADDKPVAGATVIATAQPEEDEDPRQPATTTSGDDGRFRIEGVARRKIAVRAEKDGQGPAPTVVVDASKASSDVTLRLTSLGWIAGTVVDADGQPVKTPAKLVFANERARVGDREQFAEADLAAGAFRTAGIAGGRWTAERFEESGGRSRVFAEPTIVSVAEGRAAGPIVLRVIDGAHASGSVVDEAGGPIVGAGVVVALDSEPKTGGSKSGASKSGADGRWSVDGLAAGSYVVSATAAGRAPAFQRLTLASPGTEGASDVRLVLARPAEVRVRVQDDQGKPHARALVELERDGTTMPTVENPFLGRGFRGPTAETDGEGVVVLHVSPGPLRVTARRSVSNMTMIADVEAKAGERVEATIVIPVGKPER